MRLTIAFTVAVWVLALGAGVLLAVRLQQPHPEVPRPASLTAQLAPLGPISPLIPPELGEGRP